MRKHAAFLNFLIPISPIFIPRIPPGNTLQGDPIFQILYVLLLIPAIAVGLNLFLEKQKAVPHPRVLTFSVVALAPLAFYLNWAISAGQVPFRTDTGSILLWLVLTALSAGLAAIFFGIPNLMQKYKQLSLFAG